MISLKSNFVDVPHLSLVEETCFISRIATKTIQNGRNKGKYRVHLDDHSPKMYDDGEVKNVNVLALSQGQLSNIAETRGLSSVAALIRMVNSTAGETQMIISYKHTKKGEDFMDYNDPTKVKGQHERNSWAVDDMTIEFPDVVQARIMEDAMENALRVENEVTTANLNNSADAATELLKRRRARRAAANGVPVTAGGGQASFDPTTHWAVGKPRQDDQGNDLDENGNII